VVRMIGSSGGHNDLFRRFRSPDSSNWECHKKGQFVECSGKVLEQIVITVEAA
jgi:hypothetical protein